MNAAALGTALWAAGALGAFAQAGSTGGTLGNTDKSISGERHEQTPERPAAKSSPKTGPRGLDHTENAPASRLGGRWHWRADCGGIGGIWEGLFSVSQSSSNSFSGDFLSEHSQNGWPTNSFPQPIVNGRIDGDVVSFDRHVAGMIQKWNGTIDHGRMAGSVTACGSWTATR
jgi:hypothetical protein